ncbi:polysaccharide deacetylase family protein [Psychroserpens sp. Hel_I_66]|uniref:polysaccharide deacetylase family protein n=1 Tax=Psychroserpens sp. Hel_I_66 TaxID=1250004 RepID=UPI000645F1C5|nr:polysaccharide deacetylase family protein [Psychroserpens sp. Hel_I_66]
MAGHLVISLDFELHWGVFDHKSVSDYFENLKNVTLVIEKLLELSDNYNIKLTFSTVGFLFAKDKDELLHHIPKKKPTYTLESLNPYKIIDSIGYNEADDPFHYAKSLIRKIENDCNHEIGTHTFSHFYCHAEGQTPEQFDQDLNAAIHIAKPLQINSIVFPKNQINPNDEFDKPYLDICKKYGITNFRGKEKSFIYNIHSSKKYRNLFIFKALKPLDAYFNITGYNTYNLNEVNKNYIIFNIPSSRFLRPYNLKLRYFESLKLRRIKKAMTHAAKNNEVYHLWWHPHNFGTHIEENFKNLETIFETYQSLNKTYNFKSETMTGLTKKLTSN